MTREGRKARSRAAVVIAMALLLGSACSLGTDAPNKPTSVRVRVEGTSPHQLALITSTDFYETYRFDTGEIAPFTVTADTALIGLPYDATLDISRGGSIYVELRNMNVTPVTVRLRVELDNGQGSDRTATLDDKAGLVYYYTYRDSWY